MALEQDIFVGDDGGQEATKDAQKMQARVREAKQRAIAAKEQQENQRQQTQAVRDVLHVFSFSVESSRQKKRQTPCLHGCAKKTGWHG